MIKKQLLTKQKGIDSCSLLPQKWLVCLLTLLATFVGSGRMWADDIEIWKVDFGSLVGEYENNLKLGTGSDEFSFKADGAHTKSCYQLLMPNSTEVLTDKIFGYDANDWKVATANTKKGIWNNGSGPRYLVVKNVIKGQRIVIDANATITAGQNAKVSDTDDKTLIVTASGHAAFSLASGNTIYSISLIVDGNIDTNGHKIYTGDVIGIGSDGFQTAYSNYFELESGKQYHFTYHIDGGDTTWKNWFLDAAKTAAHTGDTGYEQLLRVRADKFFSNASNFHLYKNNMSTELNAATENINTFGDDAANAALRNANVDMTVTYADNRLFIFAKTTGTNGTNIYMTGVQEVANDGNSVQLFFGVEEAIMSNLVAEKRDVYKETVRLEKGQGTGKITIDEIDAPYYENEGQKISYMASGTDIKIYATPATGYICEGIGLVSDNPRSFTTRAQNDVFSLKFQGVTYVLNGGEGKTDDPMNEEITLPTPTKAGYSFIGWMNANTDIIPTAGYAGDKKTYTEATTLYALWYKNNCEIDFTSSGPLNGTPDKTGADISETGVFMAGGTSVGNITINSNVIDSRFGVQTGTSWQYRNGLFSYNSGYRAYGINGCLEGEYITINSNANPNVNAADAELVSNVGNTYIYKVNKDGAVKFTPARNSVLYSVAVASPCPHYVYTNGNVGASDELRDWWQNWSQFYKIQKGQTLNFKFTMHGGNTSIDNWCLVAQTGTKHNGDLGLNSTNQEKLIVRANGYCWGTNGSGNATMTKNSTNLTVNSGWTIDLTDDNFTDDNKNAVVDIKVEYASNGVMTVTATTVANERTYVLTKSSTAISDDILYLGLNAKNSWIEGITHPITFADKTPSITTSSNGTAVYEQHAVGNPEGTWVEYSIVGEPTGGLEASISQISGSPDYTLSVKGKGTVTIKGTCGGNSDTYKLTVDGLIFQKPTPVYTKNAEKKYEAVLVTDNHSNVTYKLNKFDTTEGLRDVTITETSNGCSVTGIPDDKGGIIVVRAERTEGGNTSVAEFCLTVPYDLHVWDMYHDPLNYGSIVEGNATDAFTGDDTQNEKHRVGSAHYVIYNAGNSYTYNKTVDGVDQSVTDGNRVAYNNWMDGQDYNAKENWYNEQTGTQTCNVEGGQKNYDVLHKYWRFTYKTCSYKDGVRTYVNEPLFAYKNPVIGDNGRIIKETAGLIFNSPALRFGVSDNDTKNGEGGTTAVREQDRCVLMQVGSSMTIPHVKKDRYVRIHWYRHSDNNGDRCTITNGIDLDGRKINPTDVIRFTGSHYYDDHKGSFVFKVGGDTPNDDGTYDVTISTVISGWTEIYRVEVMDKFDSELQLAEVDVANKITADQVVGKRTSADIGKPYATIDNWNSKDLNNVDNYNRSVFNEESANHPVLASRLVSKIRTKAKADAEGRDVNTPVTLESGELAYAPELYISGYPGHCFTWNGWMNTTLQAEFNGSARCKVETRSDAGWTQDNTIPADPVWVGNNIKYTMHPLKEVMGEGTIKLTLRTHSGREGEPHYTFDKQEAYVAVGQYSVQKYPYTWDFTNYNFGLDNKYGSKTFDAMKNDAVNKTDTKEYGHWRKNSDNVWSMHAYQTKISGSMGGHTVKDDKKLNKPYFAQGAQLALGTVDSKHTILETEGLRVTIPALSTGTDLVKLVASDEAANTDKGFMTICSGGTITIPEVTAGMYVFVKGTTPKSASNTIASDVIFELNANVTYYKAETTGDVTLTFDTDATLYKIGVTDQVKPIAYFGYATESRAKDIDYNETRYFSAPMKMYYLTGVGGWDHRSDKFDLGNDLEVKPEASIQEIADEAYIEQGTGIILKHTGIVYDKSQKDNFNSGNPYYVPLFVPACNIPPTAGPTDSKTNLLIASTNKTQESASITPALEDAADKYYTLNISYVEVDREDNNINTQRGEVYTDTPRFYRFVGEGKGDTKSYELSNLAYLKFSSSTAKVLGDFIGIDFEDEDTEATDIKSVDIIENNVDDGTYYNLRGQAINGKPTTRGVYIKNGKKYYVK